MLYPQVDVKNWTELYGIRTKGQECPKCSFMLEFNIPIAMKGYRGLETSACASCGYVSNIFRVVPIDSEKKDLWQTLTSFKK